MVRNMSCEFRPVNFKKASFPTVACWWPKQSEKITAEAAVLDYILRRLA